MDDFKWSATVTTVIMMVFLAIFIGCYAGWRVARREIELRVSQEIANRDMEWYIQHIRKLGE